MLRFLLFFFFNDTATTEIYTLSLHDALPISASDRTTRSRALDTGVKPFYVFCVKELYAWEDEDGSARRQGGPDRKSTRLNSSHANISYAVFCLKKKK